ncbi:hypothetical protein [Terrarubrum flagellatum]|uniref:hypothetical protein n=1 Tax=Terrirubrum flagellatum TaxID=2895980 RepID=UPI00314520DE
MTDLRASAAPPSLGDLINSGIDYAKSAKATIPYVVASLGAMILPALLGPTFGGILAFVCSIATIFIGLMASREAITGEFAYKDSDPMAALKLVGIGILIGIVLMIFAMILAMILGISYVGILISSLVLMAIIVAAIARIAFVFPALAMNDPISVQSVLNQTAPYWIPLIGLFIAAALPNVLLSALFGGFGGFIGLIFKLIGAVISVVVGLVALGAVSRLYGQRARSA